MRGIDELVDELGPPQEGLVDVLQFPLRHLSKTCGAKYLTRANLWLLLLTLSVSQSDSVL